MKYNLDISNGVYTFTPVIIISDVLIINKDNKSNYNFIEGLVNNDVALANKNEFQRVVDLAKSDYNGKLFIDDLDVYYNITNTTDRHSKYNTIAIPSDFDLELGANLIARVQPNGNDGYMLFGIDDEDNVTIKGKGTLIGDRYEHNYNSGIGSRTQEWGHLIYIRAAHNIIIDGLTIKKGSGDAVEIRGRNHRNNDGSLKPNGKESFNITIKNCFIDDNRRNNISVVDGTDIFIEHNTIKNAGSGIKEPSVISSNGISPRVGIDVEAFKWNAPDDNSVYDLQRCEEIHIRNNIFSENYAADVILFNGEKAYVYENIFNSEVGVATSYGYNNKVYNNTFNNKSSETTSGKGISIEGVKWANGEERHTDWEIYGNTFINYHFGTIITGDRHSVYSNTYVDCKYSVRINYNKDCVYVDNNISSLVLNSGGYNTYSSEIQIIGTTITGGVLSTVSESLSLFNVNNKLSGGLIIDSISANSIRFRNSQNIILKNSTFDSIRESDSDITKINNN